MPAPDAHPEDSYLTDSELIGALNLPEKVGRRALAALDHGIPGQPRFPQPDPRFGNRRFLRSVLQWLRNYHGVGSPVAATDAQSTWRENFDALDAATAKAQQH